MMRNFAFFLLLSAGTPSQAWETVSQSLTCPNLLGKFNLAEFGAKGLGVKSVQEDTDALTRAVNCIRSRVGGGVLYVPPVAKNKFYAYSGSPIKLPDNITIYGDGTLTDGSSSEIRNVKPDQAGFLPGSILIGNDYGPYGIFKNPASLFYPIQDQTPGQSFVKLKDQAQAKRLAVGRVILLGGHKTSKDGTDDTSYYAQVELNEVSGINGTTISVRYPISTPLSTDGAKISPVLLDLNSPDAVKSGLKGTRSIAKNIVIHDLVFSVADTDEVNGKPLQLKTGIEMAAPVQGGVFNGQFYNLSVKGYDASMPEGNMFNRCVFTNITANSSNKLFDVGYSSANVSVDSLNWHYWKSVLSLDSQDNAFGYINQGSHDVTFTNVAADGKWNGSGLIQISEGAFNIRFGHWTINLPSLTNGIRTALTLNDDGAALPVHDVSVNDFNVTAKSLPHFMSFENDTLKDQKRNVTISNSSYSGTLSSSPAHITPKYGTIEFKNFKINGTQIQPKQ